jgi:hypothetical protein
MLGNNVKINEIVWLPMKVIKKIWSFILLKCMYDLSINEKSWSGEVGVSSIRLTSVSSSLCVVYLYYGIKV